MTPRSYALISQNPAEFRVCVLELPRVTQALHSGGKDQYSEGEISVWRQNKQKIIIRDGRRTLELVPGIDRKAIHL